MNVCTRCEGFVPEGFAHCPNCRSTRSRWKLSLALAGATITLSACYGPAAQVRHDPEPAPATTSATDSDAGK